MVVTCPTGMTIPVVAFSTLNAVFVRNAAKLYSHRSLSLTSHVAGSYSQKEIE
jgi:hypothetical protein